MPKHVHNEKAIKKPIKMVSPKCNERAWGQITGAQFHLIRHTNTSTAHSDTRPLSAHTERETYLPKMNDKAGEF